MLKGIAQVKALQAHHGMGCAFLIQLVIVSVELLQQLHQGLLLPVDFGPMFMGADVLHIGSLFNPEQLVSLDHHPAHFEEVVVLIKSEIPLCSDCFIVTSPHCLVTTANLLQLGIPPESLLSGTAGGLYPLVESLVDRLCNCLLSV